MSDPLEHVSSLAGPNGSRVEVTISPRAAALRDGLVAADDIKLNTAGSYLVKGWFDLTATTLLYGKSNTGKSFFAAHLAQCITSGRTFAGARITSGPVLYLACEGGTSIQNRMLAFPKDERQHPLSILPMPVDLTGTNDAAAICELVKTMPDKPVLIVLDTLSQAIPSADENAAKDMTRFNRAIDVIRSATGAHVLVIHHSGKSSDAGARGHSCLRAAVDTEIRLERNADVATATITKQRDGPTGLSISYRLLTVELGIDDDGDAITTCVVDICDQPSKKEKTGKLAGREEISLEALREAIRTSGQAMTGSDYPSRTRAVRIEAWRTEWDKQSVCSSDKPDSQRRAFERSRDKLTDANYIRSYNGLFWVVSDAGQAGQTSDKSGHVQRRYSDKQDTPL